jgi:hypothetical protein
MHLTITTYKQSHSTRQHIASTSVAVFTKKINRSKEQLVNLLGNNELYIVFLSVDLAVGTIPRSHPS